MLGRKWIYYSVLLFSAVACAFAAFYLSSSYDYLREWYLGLNPCFYKSAGWSNNFFTPQTKSQGNLFCWLALLIAAALILHCVRIIRKAPEASGRVSLSIPRKDIPFLLAIIVFTSAFWLWGNSDTPASFDEIFSAVNCAELHPFQTVSYYMLPNNHLFFNLLNGTVFGAAEDKVLTGRIISWFAYTGTVIAAFYWFRKMTSNNLFALTAAFTVGLQFIVWAFGFQARGYAVYLLAEWVVFISLFNYLGTSRKHWLMLNTFACVIAYITLPSFLYFHSAQLIFVAGYQLYTRKPGWIFWKHQAACFCLVYIFYLPALCFSGYHALTGNKYVQPFDGTALAFVYESIPVFNYYLDFCFSRLAGNFRFINYMLLFFPLLLFVSGKKQKHLPALFIMVLLVVTVACIILMKRPPFTRIINAQLCLLLVLDIYTFYWLLSGLLKRIKNAVVRQALLCLPVLLLAVHFLRTGKDDLTFEMYGNNIHEAHRFITDGAKAIPAGSTIGFTDESFYWFYESRKLGLKVSRCPNGNEEYLIRSLDEPLPDWVVSRYSLVRKVWEYEVYKRK